MKFSTLPVLAALYCLLSATTVVADEAAELSALLSRAANDILASLKAEEEALNKRGLEATCNVRNIAIRQELQAPLPHKNNLDSWTDLIHSGSMAPLDRKSYTDAVLCLQKKIAITPTTLIPGARSRVNLSVKLLQ
jgi:tyrosinase